MTSHYASMTHQSRWRLKRWSHDSRFRSALKLGTHGFSNPRRVLDYGAGDGHFAAMLKSNLPHTYVAAYDPSPQMMASIERRESLGVIPIRDLAAVPQRFDIIFCLEVLEHLQDDTIATTIAEWREILEPEGKLVISVPVETGIAGTLKNSARHFMGERHESRGLADHLRILAGRPVERTQDSYIGSHFGFNHRVLKRKLNSLGIQIEATWYSPLPFASILSSQCIWLARVSG